ncbi:MAG: ATP-dependent zinc metalloprotease FtsH [Gemmatimonadetes bacterium]|nr:ATP-dependent zinc metalloprotease FtsH [Gemmatimonadota bacterium]
MEETGIGRPIRQTSEALTGRAGFVSDSVVKESRRVRRWTLAVTLASVLVLASVLWFTLLAPPAPQEISYSELLRVVETGQVTTLTVRPGQDVRGVWAPGTAAAVGGAHGFVASFPLQSVEEITSRAEPAGVNVVLQAPQSRTLYRDIFGYGIQLLVLGGIGFFVFTHLRGRQKSRELGQSGASSTTFDDVAGTQGASEELQELVAFLRKPDSFAALGARIPKGALLVGPPGTGKTLLARAVAGEAGVPFFSISGSEVTGFFVGMGAHRVKSLFKKARKTGGVIFIDEIDVLGGKRGRNQSHNEDDRTLNQLLVEMDGFSPSDGVVVLGATNRSEDLDPALRRPGRFDRTITVGLPTAEGREAILRLHVRRQRIPIAPDVDLARLAQLTPNWSGAELANVLNEAAITAGRGGGAVVSWDNIESARDRLLLGKERVGFRAPDREWNTVAYHEAGHALVGVVCAPEDGLHKVTIQPRGEAMGVAFFSPESDCNLYRRSYLEGQIIKGLAGRAAEELVFGHDAVTSGAGHDLIQVNGIARKMIYQLGMGAETGLLIHDGQPGALSPEAHAKMDREVHSLLERLYGVARETLRVNRAALEALAQALLERETLDGPDAVRLMEEHGLTRSVGVVTDAATERVPVLV